MHYVHSKMVHKQDLNQWRLVLIQKYWNNQVLAMKMHALKIKDKTLLEQLSLIVKIRESIQIKTIKKYLKCCDKTYNIAFYQWREMFNQESVKETLEVLIGDQFYKANLFEEDVDSLRKLHPKKYN